MAEGTDSAGEGEALPARGRRRGVQSLLVRGLLVAAGLVAIYGLLRVTGLSGYFDPTILDDVLRDSGAAGLAVVLVAFCVGELIQVPATVFMAALAGVYGFPEGAVIGAVSALVACTFAFAVVRVTGNALLRGDALAVFRKYTPYLEREPVRAVIFLRVVFGAAPPVNWLLGLSPVTWRDYLIGTVVGLTPNVIAYMWLVHEMAFDDQPTLPRWAAVVLLLGMMAVSTLAHRRMMRRLDAREQS